MSKVIDFLKANKLAQFALVLVAGIAIGALFYPTKHIEQRVKKEYQQVIQSSDERHQKVVHELSDKLDKVSSEKHSLELSTTKKIASLNIQITNLRSKSKETYYKIVKPDGTIEIRKFKESEVNEQTTVIASVKEEFSQKVKELDQRYEKIHKERVEQLQQDFSRKESQYQQTIAKMQSEKITDINPKKYGLEVGYLSNKNYYSHANIDVFGPVFLGVHTQSNFTNDFAAGAGVGLRF